MEPTGPATGRPDAKLPRNVGTNEPPRRWPRIEFRPSGPSWLDFNPQWFKVIIQS